MKLTTASGSDMGSSEAWSSIGVMRCLVPGRSASIRVRAKVSGPDWASGSLRRRVFDQEAIETFEDLLAILGDGDFLDDDFGDLDDEACDLRRGDRVGVGSSESVGMQAFEHPGGGSPVLRFLAGLVDVVDVNELAWHFRPVRVFRRTRDRVWRY